MTNDPNELDPEPVRNQKVGVGGSCVVKFENLS